MLKSLKITSCAFILCLFGLTLTCVSDVFALDNESRLSECQNMKVKGALPVATLNAQMKCFEDLAKWLISITNDARPLLVERYIRILDEKNKVASILDTLNAEEKTTAP